MSLFGNVNVKVVCMQIREIKVALNIKLGSIPDHCYVNSILHRDSTLDKMQKYARKWVCKSYQICHFSDQLNMFELA